MKSFLSKVLSFFKSILKKEPTFAQQVESFLPYVAGTMQAILAIADPPLALIINPIFSKIESALGALSAVIEDGTPAAGSSLAATAETALNSIKTNIASVLSAAQVKNATTATKITDDLNSMVTDVDLLLSNLPTAAAEAPAPAPAA